MIPATVKTPPMIAHTPVKKWANDFLTSVYSTMIGERSYMKKTPGSPIFGKNIKTKINK